MGIQYDMKLSQSDCICDHLGAVWSAADLGDVGAVRQQLTGMLRCAGRLDCQAAVTCSDQAMTLLRNLVLPVRPNTDERHAL